jgi:4-alpha-glucanotransferase
MDETLDREAERWWIERSFWDVQGNHRHATPETLEKIIAALSRTGHGPMAPAPGTANPDPAFQGPERRGWLVAIQLYSLRSRRNWGHGDFTDLAELIGLAADLGAAGIGLNPLHALFSDRPEDASPYSPNSRLFLNPLYIDVEAAPGFSSAQLDGIRERIDRLRQTDLVDYGAVAALKWPALRLAHRSFRDQASAELRQEFESFRAARGDDLARFSAFETLRQKFDQPWWNWPEERRRPTDDLLRQLRTEQPDEVEFHEFVQWVADRQLGACHLLATERNLSVGLYIDLAVGVDASGADAWIAQDAMLHGLSVGAPPDEYNTAGQDWGLTAFDPHGLVRREFEPLRHMLRANVRHAGAIRIDHVLGLMRLYVIPHGSPAKDGAYLRFPFTEMLRVTAEESRAHRCLVIGEDLGTVPENFRDIMYAWGLWSYLVMLFEREWGGAFKPPDRYREKALATFGTHDLPTFAGWMAGSDLAIKRAIGVDPGETDDDRERSRAALQNALGPRPSFLQVVAFLAATPTRLVSIAIEDILGMTDQVNVPGTMLQYPNWRRRLPTAVEALKDDQTLREISDVFRRAGRAGG